MTLIDDAGLVRSLCNFESCLNNETLGLPGRITEPHLFNDRLKLANLAIPQKARPPPFDDLTAALGQVLFGEFFGFLLNAHLYEFQSFVRQVCPSIRSPLPSNLIKEFSGYVSFPVAHHVRFGQDLERFVSVRQAKEADHTAGLTLVAWHTH